MQYALIPIIIAGYLGACAALPTRMESTCAPTRLPTTPPQEAVAPTPEEPAVATAAKCKAAPREIESRHEGRHYPPIFQLADVAHNSALNLKQLQRVRSGAGVPIATLLTTTKGKHRVFTFVDARWGSCKDNPLCKTHRVVMLSVNSNDLIVDGLYYVLEWKGFPPSIYRATATNVKLAEDLPLGKLILKDEDGYPPDFPPDGTLDGLYRGKSRLAAAPVFKRPIPTELSDGPHSPPFEIDVRVSPKAHAYLTEQKEHIALSVTLYTAHNEDNLIGFGSVEDVEWHQPVNASGGLIRVPALSTPPGPSQLPLVGVKIRAHSARKGVDLNLLECSQWEERLTNLPERVTIACVLVAEYR